MFFSFILTQLFFPRVAIGEWLCEYFSERNKLCFCSRMFTQFVGMLFDYFPCELIPFNAWNKTHQKEHSTELNVNFKVIHIYDIGFQHLLLGNMPVNWVAVIVASDNQFQNESQWNTQNSFKRSFFTGKMCFSLLFCVITFIKLTYTYKHQSTLNSVHAFVPTSSTTLAWVFHLKWKNK